MRSWPAVTTVVRPITRNDQIQLLIQQQFRGLIPSEATAFYAGYLDGRCPIRDTHATRLSCYEIDPENGQTFFLLP